MIVRPKQFYFASALLFLMALSFPIQVMLLDGHHWNEAQAIFSKMNWLNWLIMVGFILGSYLYFQASRWILFISPPLLALVVLNNYWAVLFGGYYSIILASLASGGIGFVLLPLLLPSSRAVLRDPKRRWWRRSKRINKRVSATLNPYVGDMIHGHTFDISRSGAFVCFTDRYSKNLPKIGDTVRVSFSVNSMRKVRCEAIVVRIAEPMGRYPRGMGIRFTEMERGYERTFYKFLGSKDIESFTT